MHVTPSPYSAVAYDAFWVATLAENITMLNEGNHTSREMVDGLKEAIIDSANSYFGLTGNTSLNAVGDRANGQYQSLEGSSERRWWYSLQLFLGIGRLISNPPGDNRTPIT